MLQGTTGRQQEIAVGILSHFYPPDVGGIPRVHQYTVPLYPSLGIKPIVATKGYGKKSGLNEFSVLRFAEYGEVFTRMRAARDGCFDHGDPFENSGLHTVITRVSQRITPFFKRHGIRLVNSHLFTDLLIGIDIAKKLHVPHVHMGHGAHWSDEAVIENAKAIGSPGPIIIHEYMKAIFRSEYVDFFIVPSEFTRQRYINLGVKMDKMGIVPLGVDLSLFQRNPVERERIRDDLGVANGILLLCSSSRKGGFERVLFAFAHIRDRLNHPVKLICADTTSLPADYERLATEIGINENIICVTSPAEIMPALYSAADLLISYSAFNESFGLPVLEAMACETPVLANKSGPFPELIHHRENGMLVDMKQLDEFVPAIEELVTDFCLRNHLIEGGKATVREYSHEQIAHRYARVFREVSER